MADGMFGSIYDVQAADALMRQKQAQSYGTGWQAMTRAAAGAGGMLGKGISRAFGGMTPLEAKQAKMQEVIAQFPDLDPSDPGQLEEVEAALWNAGLYDQAKMVGEQAVKRYEAQTGRITAAGKGSAGTAKHQNDIYRARALVQEHGGDLQTAYNYVVTHPTGQVAFDLGVGYERFLGGKTADADVEIGDEFDDSIPVTSTPPTLESITAEKGRLANIMTGAAPQDMPSLQAQLKNVESQEQSVNQTLTRLEKFSKDNVKPIGNELKNISDVRTFWDEAVQGNIAAVNRLKTSLAKLGGDNRVGIQEVQTTLGGGDIIERLKRSVNSIVSGDLTAKDAEDVKRIIDALDIKYNEKMSGVIDRGRGAFGGVAADQYLDAYLPRVKSPRVPSVVTPEQKAQAVEILKQRGAIK